MQIPTLKCSTCSNNIDPFDVKYHNEEKTAAFKLMEMKKSLGKGSGERIPFDAVPVNGYREQGRFGSVPQRNIEYFRETKFKYEGERFPSRLAGC